METVSQADFDRDVLQSDKPVLVEFGGKWCGPCKALAPVLESVAKETAGRAKIVTVDVDDDPELATRYGVRGVPTVLAFERGAVKGQIVGLTTKAKLLALLG